MPNQQLHKKIDDIVALNISIQRPLIFKFKTKKATRNQILNKTIQTNWGNVTSKNQNTIKQKP